MATSPKIIRTPEEQQNSDLLAKRHIETTDFSSTSWHLEVFLHQKPTFSPKKTIGSLRNHSVSSHPLGPPPRKVLCRPGNESCNRLGRTIHHNISKYIIICIYILIYIIIYHFLGSTGLENPPDLEHRPVLPRHRDRRAERTFLGCATTQKKAEMAELSCQQMGMGQNWFQIW